MKLCRICKKIIPDNETWCDNPNCKNYAMYIARIKLEDVSRNYRGKRELLYHSKEWRQFRKKILTDRPLCENCGKNKSTTVHHISYVDPYDENSVLALCNDCHNEYYGTRRR